MTVHDSASVQAQDARGAFEGAEQECDPSVLAKMRHRLGTAAGEVEIRDTALIEHAERVESLRREVHVAVGRERRRGHEEDRLALDPLPQLVGDARYDRSHQATGMGS